MNIQEAKKVIEKEIKPEYERLRQYDGYKYTGGWLEAIETILDELEFYKEQSTRSTAQRVMTSLKDSKKAREDLEMLNEGWKIELDKKDKIINEMAKVMKSGGIVFYGARSHKHIIEYFTKKVEGK